MIDFELKYFSRGSTACVAIIQNVQLLVANAGDSRCVLSRKGQVRELLKSKVECSDFLQKLENAQASVPQNLAEEGSLWDMVNENDLWEGGNPELEGEDYVLVRQEDIVDGIACFMAAYLLSLKQTKVVKNENQD